MPSLFAALFLSSVVGVVVSQNHNVTCVDGIDTIYYYEQCHNHTHVAYYFGNCTTGIKEEWLDDITACSDYGEDLVYCHNQCGGVVCSSHDHESDGNDDHTAINRNNKNASNESGELCEDAKFQEEQKCPGNNHHFEATTYSCSDSSTLSLYTQECENNGTYSNELLEYGCEDLFGPGVLPYCNTCNEVSLCSSQLATCEELAFTVGLKESHDDNNNNGENDDDDSVDEGNPSGALFLLLGKGMWLINLCFILHMI